MTKTEPGTMTLLTILTLFNRGEPIQVYRPLYNEEWVTPTDEKHIASSFIADPSYVRLAPPKLIPIDLSVLLGSIDCEFARNAGAPGSDLGQLIEIVGDSYHRLIHATGLVFASHSHCTPRLNYWFHWQGGKCPLPAGLSVTVQTHSSQSIGNKCTDTSNHFNGGARWQRHPIETAGNIIAFKIHGPADGYCWPWEVDQLERV